jgi:hypothetical protein
MQSAFSPQHSFSFRSCINGLPHTLQCALQTCPRNALHNGIHLLHLLRHSVCVCVCVCAIVLHMARISSFYSLFFLHTTSLFPILCVPLTRHLVDTHLAYTSCTQLHIWKRHCDLMLAHSGTALILGYVFHCTLHCTDSRLRIRHSRLLHFTALILDYCTALHWL